MNLQRALEIQKLMPQPDTHDLAWLATAAQGCKAIVELGSFIGASTRAMLDNSEARIWCVDSWRGSETKKGLRPTEKHFELFLEHIHDVRDRVVILKMFTREAVTLLPRDFFDMVFIDADHSYSGVRSDILNYSPLVKLDGLLCGHDYEPWRRGLVRAVDELVAAPQKAGQMIWWTRKGEGWRKT